MTATRLAIAGALLLNIPTIFAATALSAGAILISVLVLAAIGAALAAEGPFLLSFYLYDWTGT